MTRQLPRTAALIGLLVLCSLAVADQGERTDNSETTITSQLRGTWVAVSMEQGGRKENPPKGHEMTFVFDGGKLRINEGTHPTEGTYTTNDTKNPREIDLIPPKELKGAPTIKGIYRIDGDTLKLAFTHGGTRPTGFESKDDNSGVIVFKRKR